MEPEQIPTNNPITNNENSKFDSRQSNWLVVVVEVVAVVLIIGLSIYFFTDFGKDPEVLLKNKKAELMEVVSNAEGVPLSEKQKTDILNTFGGSNTAKYNFTDEEKERILKALNGNI